MISFAVSDTCRKRVLFTSLSVSKSNTLSEMSLTRCSTASLVGRSRMANCTPSCNDFNTCECSVCLAAISFASFSTSLLFSNVFASASRCLILAKTEALSSLSVVGTIIEDEDISMLTAAAPPPPPPKYISEERGDSKNIVLVIALIVCASLPAIFPFSRPNNASQMPSIFSMFSNRSGSISMSAKLCARSVAAIISSFTRFSNRSSSLHTSSSLFTRSATSTRTSLKSNVNRSNSRLTCSIVPNETRPFFSHSKTLASRPSHRFLNATTSAASIFPTDCFNSSMVRLNARILSSLSSCMRFEQLASRWRNASNASSTARSMVSFCVDMSSCAASALAMAISTDLNPSSTFR
mmetsp:Transcript_6156/g.18288  ORF Transcript_6156/g.18288 Transcript_6156/m.18288 type:complete len:352 (-) Transcript_6156:217-1272(-)